MTLDVYADLFDSDLTSVAESVGKMWARNAEAHMRGAPRVFVGAFVLVSGGFCCDSRLLAFRG
jgi:hypothetical protein